MAETENTQPTRKKFKQTMLSWLPYIAIPLVVYFGNVEVQSYLGKKALEEIELPKLSLEEALSEAAIQDKLVIADLSAIWCPSCRKLDQNVLAKPEVKAAIERDFVFSRIEYESDEGKAFAEKYNVSGFPTLLVLDPQGNKLRKLPLTFSPQEFINLL